MLTFACMLKRCALVLIGLLLFFPDNASGQVELRSTTGLKWHGGFLFAHHPDMRHLISRHFGFGEAYFQHRFSGSKDWHHHYLMPSWGISAMHMPFPNEALGDAYAVSAYYLLPIEQSKTVALHLKLGAGLSYLSERFQRTDNHKNIAISSRANVILRLGPELTVNILRRLQWHTGLDIIHFSNGAVKMPNLGLNFLTISSGLSYRFGDYELPAINKPGFVKSPGWSWSVFAGVGIKQARIGQGDVRPAVTVQVLTEKRLTPKFSFGAGAEVNANANLPIAYEAKEIEPTALTPYRSGLLLSGAFHFGRMAILTQMGGYLLDVGRVDGLFFNRFGLRHDLSDKVKINFTLRTHFAKADHFEAGIVYQFAGK